MVFEETGIDGLLIIRQTPQLDERGAFARIFCENEFAAVGHTFRVAQANRSYNTAPLTLRGLHFQRAPYAESKVVSCRRGRIWDVAVDLRPNSSTFRQWRGFELSSDDHRALFIAEGFAHGFLTLEPYSEVDYLMGAAFVPDSASGLRWDDPALAIEWPSIPAVMSKRDQAHPLLKD